MITLYGFGQVFKAVIGETKDLRVQWALEEMGIPYRVHGLDHTGGEHNGAEYDAINPLHRVPAMEDDGFTLFESGAVLLYLAEKSGKLIAADFQGRMRVTQWCFAALNTIERPMQEIQLIDKFGGGPCDEERRVGMVAQAVRSLDVLERRLDGRDWIASAEFTVADILLVTVLRQIRRTDLLQPYPRVAAYLARALARPAWQRALALYAQRLDVVVAEIA